MKKVSAIILVAMFCLFALAGCASPGEKIAEKLAENIIEKAAEAEGEDVDVDIESGEVTMQTDEGEELNIGSSDLPDDFPNEIPINSDINIFSSYKFDTEGKKNWGVTGEYSGNGEDLMSWYKNAFEGWEITSESSMAFDEGNTYMLNAENSTYSVSVIITEGEEAAISLNVSEK